MNQNRVYIGSGKIDQEDEFYAWIDRLGDQTGDRKLSETTIELINYNFKCEEVNQWLQSNINECYLRIPVPANNSYFFCFFDEADALAFKLQWI